MPFLGDETQLAVEPMIAMKARRDELRIRRLRQQVTSELFDGELIKGLVFIEGADHPIAPWPHHA